MIQFTTQQRRPNVLLITGSVNQTTQMHQIARQLPDCDCYFSQIYADSALVNWVRRKGWADHTVLGGKFRADSETYLRHHNLPIDYRGEARRYDLVVLCSDMLVPANIRATRSVWVQEGMVDPATPLTWLVKYLGLPGYLAMNTSLNGSSTLCDVYCVASEGYREFFNRMGTARHKLFVTGMPNFDNLAAARDNDFPHRDYVMVATTDMRETFRPEDRPAFLRRCVEIANGRPMLVKLHPNEVYERAAQEVRDHMPPDTLLYHTGNTNAMIANCAELITQYSTVVYTGMAMDKPVHSYFDLDTLRRQMPIQNGGRSAQTIARLCRAFLQFDGPKDAFTRYYTETHLAAEAYALAH